MIGARGGTALVSGRIRLTCGAGALAADTPIRMTQYAETIGVDLDGETSEPVVAQFSAEPGMVFGAAVTASFDLAGLIPNDRVAQLRTVYFEPLTRTLGTGAVVTEKVFARPGLGTLLLEAIAQRDYRVVQGLTLVIAVMYVLINLIVDVLYAAVDPRIRV